MLKKKRILRQTLVLVMLMVSNVGIASSVFGDTFYFGRYQLNSNLNAYYDSSVDTYGYAGTYDLARQNWLGISSKASVYRTYSTSNYPDKYYVGTTATDNYGITLPYDETATGFVYETGYSSIWKYVTISLYANNMPSTSWSSTNRAATATHEVGHSLKLAHPGNGSERVRAVPSGQKSVMEQGKKDYYVQPYDVTELLWKWGS